MGTILYKLYHILDSRSRLEFFLLLIPLLVTALLEMLSLGMALPLMFSILSQDAADKQNQILTLFLGLFDGVEPDYRLHVITATFIFLFIFKNIAFLLLAHAFNWFYQIKQAEYRQSMFNLYLRQPYEVHLHKNSAETMRNLHGGIGGAFHALQLTLNLFFESLVTILICILLLLIDPQATIIISLTLLAVGLLYNRGISPIFRSWGDRIHELEAKIFKTINQSFGAIKDIKIHHCYPYMNLAFASDAHLIATLRSRNLTVQNVPRALIEIVVILLLVGIAILFLNSGDSVQEILTILGLFSMGALRLMPSTTRILGCLTMLRLRAAAVDTIYEDFTNRQLDEKQPGNDDEDGGALLFDKEISLENISYAFPSKGRDGFILENINLEIAKGEVIGIVGSSGAGKTTLVNILLGLLQPKEGRLLIDGVDAFKNKKAWQRHLGYVPQDIYLLDDTLRKNITFGINDEDIDETRVKAAIGMAHLEKMASDLSDGLDTVVGERGIRISGGQRQRIGIARALYRNPDVLVFDEATSALDSETEQEILKAIEGLIGTKTMVIIAHRLTTVLMCDRLVFMKDGHINDTGSFDELMARNTNFKRMADIGDGETVSTVK